jgi:hypothetical protein
LTLSDSSFKEYVAKTFGASDDWRVRPGISALNDLPPRKTASHKTYAKARVAVALARQQPELVNESADIRNLRPMLARLWLQDEYLEVNGGNW